MSYFYCTKQLYILKRRMIFQSESMLCSSKLLREEDLYIYKESIFSPETLQRKALSTGSIFLLSSSASQTGWAEGCLLPAASTCTPARFWANQCLYWPASCACRKGQQLLPKRFSSPVPLASAQYVQPWPAMAGFLNRLLPTVSWFLRVIWALECSGRIQPNYMWFLESSMLELLTTLKGPDLIHNMLIPPKNILLYMNMNLQTNYSLASVFYIWSQERIFTLSI